MMACSVPEIHCTQIFVTEDRGGGIGYSSSWISPTKCIDLLKSIILEIHCILKEYIQMFLTKCIYFLKIRRFDSNPDKAGNILLLPEHLEHLQKKAATFLELKTGRYFLD